MTFDVREIPFSTRGAWFGISPVVGLHETADDLHLVSHQNGMHAVLALIPVVGEVRAEVTVATNPSRLRWSAASGTIDAAFEGPEILRLRGVGLGLRIADASGALTPFTGTYLFRDPVDGAAMFTSYETGRRYRVTSLAGDLTITGAQALGVAARMVVVGGEDGWEIALEEMASSREPFVAKRSFDEAESESGLAFRAFLEEVAPPPGDRSPAAALASYVLWSAAVRPLGYLGRESILMSKHWMDKVWSWDHCFNALALARAEPRAALDQFQLVFDHQDSSGALPDSITHSQILYNFVKPPIHGWALRGLRRRLPEPIEPEVLSEIYRRLAQWTRFWLDRRRVPGHELAHYQHGNDSGWDNATSFDADRLIESPDLAAFLVIQLDVLAELAEELGTGEAPGWRARRDAMARALIDELWDGRRFVTRGLSTGTTHASASLLQLLPIVAAEFLPARVNQLLSEQIQAHLTEHGLATELPTSAHYAPDGYWRGPIWAPSTMLIVDGLRLAGFAASADEVSRRFLRLCERSGFAENFDALTGEGLRDRAYTWTASAYLLLSEPQPHP